MKTIEEKARAYDEVLKQIKECTPDENGFITIYPQEIFPELKEPEDEKVRKEIIDFLKLPHPQFVGKRDHEKWIAWLEKQSEQKEYTFKSLPRLLDMIEPTSKAKAYCQKLIDTLVKERYSTDAKIVGECLKKMNDEDVPMAIMDEKQGEQKHTDKVEPKFKIGDWVIDKQDIVHQIANVIENVTNHTYCYDIVGGGYFNDNTEGVRLWTINDAKDGDVLACPLPKGCESGEQIFIFKGINSRDYVDNCIEYYCRICEGIFYENENGYMGTTSSPLYPSTKEQRDALFAKMKEAGYEWDAEKKELKKINSYCQENCKGFQETGKCFADEECKAKREAEQELTNLEEFINELSKQFPDVSFAKLSRIVVRVAKWAKSNQPKQEWSEEDETNLTNIIIMLKEGASHHFLNSSIVPCVNWLISLKDRVGCKANCTTTKEWSEEDSIRLQRIIDFLWYNRKGDTDTIYQQEQDIDWLKSLRPQNRWKPSDKQMRVLWCHCSEGSVLTSLYNDLKKLKES